MIEFVIPPYVEQYCASRTNLSVEAKLRLQFKAGGLCVVIRVDDDLLLLTSKPICVFNLVRIILIFSELEYRLQEADFI